MFLTISEVLYIAFICNMFSARFLELRIRERERNYLIDKEPLTLKELSTSWEILSTILLSFSLASTS